MWWNDVKVDMKKTTCTKEDSFHVEKELFVSDKKYCIAKILDAKYKPANLRELTANLQQLNANQWEQLYNSLKNYATLFDGMLGLWKGNLYKIELQDSAQPHHAKPYRVPQAYKKTFKQEVERLCNVVVLRK